MKTGINENIPDERSWEKVIMKYNHPDIKKSLWQLSNSILPYLFTWYLMYRSLDYSYWITILLSLVASGFLIRIFIIFHDCGHRSFFTSTKANTFTGILTGILTLTPYYIWHHQHKIHHSTSGNLDKRGTGDVWTMTVDEYLNSTPWKKLVYRTFRNPFMMFIAGPVFLVLFQNRLTRKGMTKQERWNVYFTNTVIVAIAALLSAVIGLKAFLLIQLPIAFFAHSMGIWLFYIQHQFDNVEWERQTNWDYKIASLRGSSFLKLPSVFQWFTGNIGFHHVHHLSSRIPNYYLSRCHYENDLFSDIQPLRFSSLINAFTLRLWDETSSKMISFSKLRHMEGLVKPSYAGK
jgi:acyl-lipid omega-6 desaturase (Delta-12 desaturase)